MRSYEENDSLILASGGYDHTIKFWETDTGFCKRTVQHAESQVNALEVTPDQVYLAAASYQHVYMYDLVANNSSPVINFEGATKNITDIGFQQDAKWMYSGGEDCKARIWDLKDSASQAPRCYNAGNPITSVCLHPNQVELFIGDQNGIIHRWDLKTDNTDQIIPEQDAMILDIAIDPLGHYMASVNSKGRCYIWELQGSSEEPTKIKPKFKFDAHNKYALKVLFSHDSSLLATTSGDQSLKIWSMKDYSLIQEFKQEGQRWVWDAAFSGDDQYIFSASSDGVVRLWNVSNGNIEREYAGHQKAVTAIAFKDSSVLP
ncbi:target of rapamycin complex subunit lst8 [Harmonia axyridis]|uniref:target of rapamycin complex subunit lst8 n=1 Tax=Harmonia axyridis TaxID=115357 RepID=UPI001E2780F6|nr:target of rapamycin complex subunit lst8 [Harmonia axyridis]